MRLNTPKATPVATASPAASLPPPGHLDPRRRLLPPVLIVTPHIHTRIEEGSVLLGRSGECDIVLEDPLVSRMHARIFCDEGGVSAEDLHSSNGMYLNGLRIPHRTPLSEGDRLLLGTCEISVFSGEATSGSRKPVDRGQGGSTAPPPRSARYGMIDVEAQRAIVGDENPLPTARADALRLIGSLAQRLASEGQTQEAQRILTGHLRGVLRGANLGLDVTRELCELASQHALQVARWSKQSIWVDYVVELHLSARHLMSYELIVALEHAELWGGACDSLLLAYYVESVEADRVPATTAESERLNLLRKLAQLGGR